VSSKNPDVSVIITNYNYEKYISRAVRSCLNQSNVRHEVIVVDDCSTDDSIEVLSPFREQIKVVSTGTNGGVAFASNLGVKEAKGQFFIRVDADDYVNSDMCYMMKTYLEANHDAFCVSCDYLMVDDYENVLERKYAEVNNISCGIMYRRDLFLSLGGYNGKMRHREEEELRKRLGQDYKIHHLKIPFYRYRMHNTNKTKEPEYKTWEI
jgi:glycosyltransferase involved in cell wall biosynthesis